MALFIYFMEIKNEKLTKRVELYFPPFCFGLGGKI